MGRQVIGRRGWLLAAATVVLIGGIAAVQAPREVASEHAQVGGRKKATDVVKIKAVAGKADGGKVPVTVRGSGVAGRSHIARITTCPS